MNDIAKKHQMKIARSTIKMTPASARIMGGMDFETAYKLIYREDLIIRLKRLIAEYGKSDSLVWEMQQYGWNSPQELLDQL